MSEIFNSWYDNTTNAPERLCAYCGKSDHGSVACNNVNNGKEVMPVTLNPEFDHGFKSGDHRADLNNE
jgi:hypothetical protein